MGRRTTTLLSGWLLVPGLVLGSTGVAWSTPQMPADDAQVLAELPPGARHESAPARELASAQLDIALPLAQFYISRSRASGDLRYLGYAEAVSSNADALGFRRDRRGGAGVAGAARVPADRIVAAACGRQWACQPLCIGMNVIVTPGDNG